ncbi:LytTR family DNA-binding domain-containing protein [Halocynthiibacter styelae]|uniref:LytTR family transcriptional regulator n=1 Tax=Halocynthiibacter styelae TaxID=2761955 RepID=A0A8J7IBV5_9RHOB|nr:LytTR family DNA-binding domain-containing protein [Paenihalocynthiibacter styelae]MBI1492613.1 LytTR family transcriptional regulator [Paenihalocynthiibacter styelae]
MKQVADRFREIFLSTVNLNLMVLAWIIFVTADPFDTSPKLTGLRSLGYWVVTTIYSSVLLCFFIAVNDVRNFSLPAWLRRVLAAVIYGAVSVSFGRVVFINFAADPESFGWPRLPHYAFGAAIGMLVFVVVDVFRFAIERAGRGNQGDPASAARNDVVDATETSSEIRLLSRVPEDMRGKLIRVSAQDHFVEIYTCRGKHRLRMRLRDAIADLPDGMGVLVHRSHWVAVDQVKATLRQDGKLLVRLKDGNEVPVSRNGEAAMKKRGLI